MKGEASVIVTVIVNDLRPRWMAEFPSTAGRVLSTIGQPTATDQADDIYRSFRPPKADPEINFSVSPSTGWGSRSAPALLWIGHCKDVSSSILDFAYRDLSTSLPCLLPRATIILRSCRLSNAGIPTTNRLYCISSMTSPVFD
jgi:hypothetical protein